MKLNIKTILITSNEPWGDVWFSKQHYAYELSKLGHQVYFINPTSKWNWGNIFSFKVDFTATNYENLTVVNYKNNFPQTIFSKFFTYLNDFLNCIKINKNISLNNSKLIWWKFDPFRFISSFPFNKSRQIYHVVDPYNSLWHDKYQATNSDLIICINTSIKYYLTNFSKKKIIYIPHGISEEELLVDSNSCSIIRQKHGDFILLVGTISNTINFDLLEKIADNVMNTLVIVGKQTELKDNSLKRWNDLKNKNNVIFNGPVNSKEIKNWVSASKICIVVYNYNLKHQTSLKIMNYLAGLKPIVSTLNGELLGLNNEGIYCAKNDDEFLDFLNKGVNDELLINENKINTILLERRYDFLIKKILTELSI